MSIQVKQQTSLLDNVIHPIPYVLIGCKVFFINTTTVAYDVHQCVTMCRHSLLFNLYSSYHYWCALRSCVGLSVLCGVSYALAQRRTLGFLSLDIYMKEYIAGVLLMLLALAIISLGMCLYSYRTQDIALFMDALKTLILSIPFLLLITLTYVST